MSLRARIALLVAVVVIVSAAFAGVGTAITSRTLAQNRIDRQLITDAEALQSDERGPAQQILSLLQVRQATCAEGEDATTTRGQQRTRRLAPEFAAAMQVVDSSGTVLSACQLLPITDRVLQVAVTQQGSHRDTVVVDGRRLRMLTVGVANVGAVQLARDLDVAEETLRGLVWRLAAFGLAGAALAGALGWFFAARASAPVRELSATAERVAQTQDLGQRIDIDRRDELGQLAVSFNTMMASLDQSREQQTRLVQDASHELRTPLTSLRTNIELLQRHESGLDPTTRAQVLGEISSELQELTDLTAELVDSATEVPREPAERLEVDLAAVVRDAAERARRRSGRTITVTTDDSVVVGDASLLRRAVDNLLNNAIKFSDSDVEVAVREGAVTVHDRGPGIAEADLGHIFDRFWRSTEARSAPGSGLGLSIVRQIVEAHGGSVTAANRIGGGAAIGFVLSQPSPGGS